MYYSMSNEEITEELLMKAHRDGIYKQVMQLADHYIKINKMSIHDAFHKAYLNLKPVASK